ncbi:MAG: hypothetical protein LAT62_03215 [Natronospirillum sp.]|uniref:hypothetical protein n=1 Tax=Natronospirillum sp. TaxID=2812955 RepID=UPI0025FE069B|nr:hypothetical protein [Natronospirillum sp.]MCH8550919.1 hypothetical protein [Natronospirillum sp.]
MSSTTLLMATETLDQFIRALDDVYWEASDIADKDVIFNISRVLTNELIELHKVSIQDGHYKYEPVGENLRTIIPQLSWLNDNLSRVTRRTDTTTEIQPLLRTIHQLIS